MITALHRLKIILKYRGGLHSTVSAILWSLYAPKRRHVPVIVDHDALGFTALDGHHFKYATIRYWMFCCFNQP